MVLGCALVVVVKPTEVRDGADRPDCLHRATIRRIHLERLMRPVAVIQPHDRTRMLRR